MAKLNKDTTRCANKICHLKETCLRSLARQKDKGKMPVVVFRPNLKGECWYYIPESYPQNTSYTK